MMRASFYAIFCFLFATSNTWAIENIIRPYQSARAAGMGNVRTLTGLYAENFFGNPARVVDNPEWRIQLPSFMVETNRATISAYNDFTGGSSDAVKNIGTYAGEPLHARVQTIFPSVYFPSENGFSWAFGIISSIQADLLVRNSYSLDMNAIADIGPAFTIGHRFGGHNAFAVGLTSHLTYRLSSPSGFSLIDVIQGQSLSPIHSGGEGAHLDFDIGLTYRLPVEFLGFSLRTGLSINNLLGGWYKNVNLKIFDKDSAPRRQPRALGLGFALERPSLWIFDGTVLSLELTDITEAEQLINQGSRSIFNLLHLGTEIHFGVLALRGGINQGYLAGGLGLDLAVFTLDFATYGEELSLNPGGLEDRRYAVSINFQI